MSSKEDSSLTKAAETLQKIAKPALKVITTVLPILIQLCQKAYSIYVKLPLEALRFLVGFIFCFFGGIYPTLFAAIQAAKYGGLKTLQKSLGDISEEITKIIADNEKDDQKDDDGDGVADVEQIDDKGYALRKVNLILTKINPQKVDDALASISKVWISVVATLTVRFARVISLSLTISDFIKKPVNRFITPIIQSAIPKDYGKWVPVIMGWLIKGIAMSVAWTIQAIISGFTSALEGGLIMSRTILRVSISKGFDMFGLIPEKHEDTNIDEYMSYIFAALGFYFQLSIGFDITFPFNILLMPFELTEYYIRWGITPDN